MSEYPHPQVRLTSHVLNRAREFFEDRGSTGCEGTALVAGPMDPVENSDGLVLAADTLVIPDQEATAVPYASVSVTPAGDLQLAVALEAHERYHVRIHSHPGLAFHSRTDDANPVLTHEGAVSIVVPFFGLGLRSGLDACAVLVYLGGRWVDLPAGSRQRAEAVSVDV